MGELASSVESRQRQAALERALKAVESHIVLMQQVSRELMMNMP
jgi:hypothetical protein